MESKYSCSNEIIKHYVLEWKMYLQIRLIIQIDLDGPMRLYEYAPFFIFSVMDDRCNISVPRLFWTLFLVTKCVLTDLWYKNPEYY